MSITLKIAKFLTGDGDAVAKPVDAVGEAFDKIFTSEEERMAAQAVLVKLKQNPLEWQVALNKIEAQSSNLFKSGWRPFIGWTCGFSLALFYIPQFGTAAIIWVITCVSTGQVVPYPVTNISGLMELVIGMLGFGALRTLEKFGRITK